MNFVKELLEILLNKEVLIKSISRNKMLERNCSRAKK